MNESKITPAHIERAVRNLRGTRVPKRHALLMFVGGLLAGIISSMVGIAIVKAIGGML